MGIPHCVSRQTNFFFTGGAFRVGGALAFALSRPAGPPWPFKLNCRCSEYRCDIYTFVTHRNGADWILLVRIGSYWFVPVPTNSHRVRIASHRIRIDSPSPPYCFVLHRIVIALRRIALHCVLPVRVQFLLIHTYNQTASYSFCLEVEPMRVPIFKNKISPPFAGVSILLYTY